MKRNNLFWCDMCSVMIIDHKGNEANEFYGCYSAQAWIKHIKSVKHTKQTKLNQCLTVDSEGGLEGLGVVCDQCNLTFTKEGYSIHEKRNKPLWDCYKTTELASWTCNNFCVGKKRYQNLDEYKESKNKPKQKRAKVGTYSPVTETTRPPNIKGGKEKTKGLVAEKGDDDYYITCKKCKGAFNDTNYFDKDFVIKFNTFLCECPDSEPESDDRDDDELPGIKLTIDDIDDIDYTQRPTYYDYCLDCNYGIREMDASKNIYNKWDMEYCECSE